MKEAERVADEIILKHHIILGLLPDVRWRGKLDLAAKQCALICVENEYHSLREMLFSLRSSKVIESEKVYLSRLEKLIELEKEVKTIIENK